MTDTRLELEIISTENGFILFKGSHNSSRFPLPSLVARSADELGGLVRNLALKYEIQRDALTPDTQKGENK